MNNDAQPLVIEESAETINKLKKELKKKEKRYKRIYNIGTSLTKFGRPVLIGSILSPFDFEGPIVEIVSAVTLTIGLGMKSYGKAKMNEVKLEKNELKEEENNEKNTAEMKEEIKDLKEELKKLYEYQKNKDETSVKTR